ncbi:hypothetical protein ASF30_11720 [Leifsonia sp. Leaf264]|nr:hypothetical protein ASF30_11720 [Leifsonia sp. Leaf264]
MAGLHSDMRKFQEASAADRTRRGYETDWAAFTAWCTAHRVVSLPADPKTVGAYFTDAANMLDSAGEPFYATGTLDRWLSSINKAHELAGHPKPGKSPEVMTTIAGIRRVRTRPINRKAPLLLPELKRVITSIDPTVFAGGVIGLRDRALLLFGFAGGFRRSELAALTISDVTLHPSDGLHVRIRSSKTDQEGKGQVKALPYGSEPVTCAPCAFIHWVRALAATKHGRPAVMRYLWQLDEEHHVCRDGIPECHELGEWDPLFRPVMKNGAPHLRHISGDVVNDVVKRRLQAVGINPARFGAHSLRAGFVTAAITNGASYHEIMRQTGHKDPATVEVYAREHAPLTNNAVTKLGL